MAITIKDLASHVLGREATTGQDYVDARLPMMGGCEVCGASVAAYNSCPSKTGYIRCEDECIDGQGWDDVEAARRAIFA